MMKTPSFFMIFLLLFRSEFVIIHKCAQLLLRNGEITHA